MVYCGPQVLFIVRNSVWVDEDKPRKLCAHAGAALELRIRMTQYVCGKIA